MKSNDYGFISAVAYVYNDGIYIEKFLDRLVSFLLDNFSNSEIILVNDCSVDNSIEIIKEYSKKISGISISLLNMSRHYGIEIAMNAGTDLSIGDYVYEFDEVYSDYENNLLLDVYKKGLEGFDIVSASPNIKQRLSSSLFYKIFNKFSDFECKMMTETFRILSRRAINRVRSMNKIIPYRKASYSLCGLNNANIQYVPTKTNSKEKNKSYRFNLALESLLVFTNFGYKVSVIMVGFMLLITMFMGMYTMVIYTTGKPVQGWTTTIMFLSIVFFGLFIIMAMIIKYLQIILQLNIQKMPYNFEGIEKLSE